MNRRRVAGSLLIVGLCAAVLAGCGSAEPPRAITTAVAADTATETAGTVVVARVTGTAVAAASAVPSARATVAQIVSPTPRTSPTAVPAPATLPPMPLATSTAAPQPTGAATVPPTATATLPPPAATATRPLPSPTAPPRGPQVLSFRVEPAVAENVGDGLRISWQAVGQEALLCPLQHGPVESRCEKVPLTGSRDYVTTEESLSYAGFGLKVTAGDRFVWGTQAVSFLCQDLRPWFFDDPPARCPAAEPVETYAAGQYFERGLMIWRQDTDLFYVLCEGDVASHNQRLYQVSPSTLAPDASPDHRVGEDPPRGLYEPVSGFGMVWRGELQYPEADFRQCLGWATEPESGFDLVEQCETTVLAGAWACYVRGPRGEILRLAAATNIGYPLVWEEYHPAR